MCVCLCEGETYNCVRGIYRCCSGVPVSVTMAAKALIIHLSHRCCLCLPSLVVHTHTHTDTSHPTICEYNLMGGCYFFPSSNSLTNYFVTEY